jgi:hypothetical protein
MNPVAPTVAGLSRVTVTLYLTPTQPLIRGHEGRSYGRNAIRPFSKKRGKVKCHRNSKDSLTFNVDH